MRKENMTEVLYQVIIVSALIIVDGAFQMRLYTLFVSSQPTLFGIGLI